MPADEDCILTGWGYTLAIADHGFIPQWVHAIFKSYPKDLQITRLATISNDECRKSFSRMQLETELCTYKWATGACAVRIRKCTLFFFYFIKLIDFREIRVDHWLM